MVFAFAPPVCASGFVTLQNSFNIDLLQLSTTASINNTTNSTANEGIAAGSGTITFTGSTLSGTEYYGGSFMQTLNCQAMGGCLSNAPELGSGGELVTDASTDYTLATGLTTTASHAAIDNTNTTITATTQLNVVNITGTGNITLTTSGDNLTLSGSASDIFVLLVSGSLDLGTSNSILLTGGLLPQNVLLVFTGTGTGGVTLSGGTINGTLLANSNYTLDLDGTINGMVVGDNTINVGDGGALTINGGSNAFAGAPEPGTWTMLAGGLMALGLFHFYRAKRKPAPVAAPES